MRSTTASKFRTVPWWLLPPYRADMEEQVQRVMENYWRHTDPLDKYTFLIGLAGSELVTGMGLNATYTLLYPEAIILDDDIYHRARYLLMDLEISEETLALDAIAEEERLMPHLHIPLQCGDNEILKRMNRRYTREQFQEIIYKCRTAVPDAAIGIDVMAGFPGETEDMFENSRNLIESTDCTYLHVFPFSKRPGTRAAEFDDQIDTAVKQRRVDILRTLGRKKSRAFYRRFINSRREALLETVKLSGDTLKGFTDNYIPVMTSIPQQLPMEPVNVELGELSGNSVLARIV